MQIDEVRQRDCRLHYTLNNDMLNGFDIIHGSVIFSAADSAFAFACNSNSSITVALDVSITYARVAKEGDILYVEAKELHLGYKTGIYDVRTTNKKNELVALFKGTAYKTYRNFSYNKPNKHLQLFIDKLIFLKFTLEM